MKMISWSTLTSKAKISSNCRKLLVPFPILVFALPTTNLHINGAESDWEGTNQYSHNQGPAGTSVTISGSNFTWETVV
jgi:hypothetical protein